jgi:hypothetical protein
MMTSAWGNGSEDTVSGVFGDLLGIPPAESVASDRPRAGLGIRSVEARNFNSSRSQVSFMISVFLAGLLGHMG